MNYNIKLSPREQIDKYNESGGLDMLEVAMLLSVISCCMLQEEEVGVSPTTDRGYTPHTDTAYRPS